MHLRARPPTETQTRCQSWSPTVRCCLMTPTSLWGGATKWNCPLSTSLTRDLSPNWWVVQLRPNNLSRRGMTLAKWRQRHTRRWWQERHLVTLLNYRITVQLTMPRMQAFTTKDLWLTICRVRDRAWIREVNLSLVRTSSDCQVAGKKSQSKRYSMNTQEAIQISSSSSLDLHHKLPRSMVSPQRIV